MSPRSIEAKCGNAENHPSLLETGVDSSTSSAESSLQARAPVSPNAICASASNKSRQRTKPWVPAHGSTQGSKQVMLDF